MELYTYQNEDVKFILDNKNILNANSVGLGKTAESIEAVKRLGATNILVVAPKALVFQWQEEIELWDKQKTVTVVQGSKKKRHTLLARDTNYHIVNYAMLRDNKKKVFEYNELFIEPGYKTKKRVWDVIIFDEAHYLKGHKTRTTKGARRLNSKKKLLLTATPIKNTPDELYSLLNIIDPEKYSSYWRFVDKYCETEKVYGCAYDVSQVVGWQKGKETLLKKEIEHIMFRREKEDLLKDLPKKIFKQYKIDMYPKQKKAYDQMEEYMATKTIEDVLQVEGELSKLLRLRQIALDPSIVDIDSKSAKTDFLLGLLPTLDSQVLIFSWFKSYTNNLYKLLKEKGYKVGLINGDVDIKDRARIIKSAKVGDIDILLGTYSTLSTGLNLQFIHTMIMLDKPWSSMDLEQAQGRIFRNGQKHSCLFLSLIMKDTIEEDMEHVLYQKTKIISKLMSVKSILKYFKKRLDKRNLM